MYAWIITKDHLADGSTITDEAGTTGPRRATADLLARLQAGEGQEFRMYDDDGELYYEGRYLGDDSEDMFGPLDDFGMPNAGAVRIDYKNDAGAWEVL